jgi:fimbrial isopeptide formation D2 family protein/LPXTG-motif cell wall-anchored protein
MKTIKKLASILLAVVMVLATAVSASASTSVLAGHTYKAYQIFKGTQAKDDTVLTDISWGSGVDWSALASDIKTDTTFGTIFSEVAATPTEADAAVVAEALADHDSDSVIAKEFAKKVYAHKTTGISVVPNETTVEAGYYLVVDDTNFAESDVNAIRNLAIVRVTENGIISIEEKTSLPEVQKKVMEKNDSTGITSGWQDAADYDIDDLVPFQLTATLPSCYADYGKYQTNFYDTMSDGLTFNEITAVYVEKGNETFKFAQSDYKVTSSEHSLTVAFPNLKSSSISANITKDCKIIVEYNATLNEKAKIGAEGNPNKVYLTYSNNPNNGSNSNNGGNPGDNSGNPGGDNPGDGSGNPGGDNPGDGSENPGGDNPGDGSGNPGGDNTGDDDEVGKTPEDQVIVFTYKLTVNKIADDKKPLAGAEFTLTKWNEDSAKAVDGEASKTAVVSEDGTTFTFAGLDAGTYKLSETKTPDGYNTAEDIVFTISAQYDEKADTPELKELTVDQEEMAATVADGNVKATVINYKGGTLPSTGGMGTRIFTVGGLILMCGAAILLVAKKRANR